MQLVISSGHGKHVRGASGYLDEVNEARKVVDAVAALLRGAGHTATTFHDDVSTSQNENLNRIVNFHNSKTRELDVSVHFNAYQTTSNPMGTECLYVSQQALASTVAAAMAKAGGFLNRGPKKRTDLFFLNSTHEPSILLEVCFVDSSADANLYKSRFDEICEAIGEAITGEELDTSPPPVQPPVAAPPTIRFGTVKGVESWDYLNVRASPDGSGTIIGHANNGDLLDIAGEDGDWYKVQLSAGDAEPETYGYVSQSYVELEPVGRSSHKKGKPRR